MALLRRQTEPFDDPDWIYEIKHDGFRGVAMIEAHAALCRANTSHCRGSGRWARPWFRR